MIPRKIKCARCGEETIAKGPRSKYCPLCGYQVRLETARMFQEALRAARGEPKVVAPKKKSARKGGTKHIKCARCGADVVVSVHATRAKSCPKCSQESKEESTKRCKERREQETITEICHGCGREFTYIFKGQYKALCEDCKPSRSSAWRKGEKSRAKPGASKIVEIQQQAQAAGMSYGQYKAWLYMQEMKKGA